MESRRQLPTTFFSVTLFLIAVLSLNNSLEWMTTLTSEHESFLFVIKGRFLFVTCMLIILNPSF